MTWNDGLRGRQLEAARHVGTHARLLAGPGTGKTLTLTLRLVKLVTEDGIPPDSILAVAFTRINACDLRRSVNRELAQHGEQYGGSAPRISTLHSFALRQLLRNSQLITSLPQPLRIADDFEEKSIIRADIAQMLDLRDREIIEKFAELSSDWQSLAVEDPDYQPADPNFMGAWNQHREVYGYTLRSELVWQLKHAVDENPYEFDLEGNIRHLLVDEYQDLNRCDLEIIRILAARGAEVFCAGDDDQSIYYFRRAHPAGIRRFPDEYRPSTLLELDVCWRCDQSIISVGQYVANLDHNRIKKPMTPREGAGYGEVHLLRFSDQHVEARGVASICRYLIDVKRYNAEDILILLRSDHKGKYSSVLEKAISNRAMAVNIRAEKGGPLDEAPGRYLLSLVRLALNSQDDLAWCSLLQFSGRINQIGDTRVASIYNYAVQNGLRFHQALDRIRDNPEILPCGGLVQREVFAVQKLTARFAELNSVNVLNLEDEAECARLRYELMEQLSDLAGIIIPSQEERQLVLAHIRRVAERAEIVTLGKLLDALASPDDTFDQELETGKINILTMHRAKGLSAKAVIIVAAEEQLVPGGATGDAFDDERRLLYVSLTRAKHHLYVTYCNRRVGWQRYSGSNPGNPRRTLTPFLRGAMMVESGMPYCKGLDTWQ